MPLSKQSTIIKKGLFHFSRDSFLLFIESRYAIIYAYLTLIIGNIYSSEAKIWLSASQLALHDTIALEKSAWSDHQSGRIHSIRLNPNEMWKSIFLFYLGEPWATTPSPPSFRCVYPIGKHLAHSFTGCLTIKDSLIGQC